MKHAQQVVNLEHIKCIIAVDHVLVLNADEVRSSLLPRCKKACSAPEIMYLFVCCIHRRTSIQFIEELQRRLAPLSVSFRSLLIAPAACRSLVQFTPGLSRQSLLAGRALLWQWHP